MSRANHDKFENSNEFMRFHEGKYYDRNDPHYQHVLSNLQKQILEVLENGPETRKNLMETLHSCWTTMYDNLATLKMLGFVEKYTFNNGKRGRPTVFWKLKEN